MTDGRIPGKWISEPRFAEMPDSVFGFLARAIAWSNEAGTDGHVKNRYLGQLHADGVPKPAVYNWLEQATIWESTSDGYQFINWDLPAHRGGLGQSLSAVVQAGKQRNKEKQQRHRDRAKLDTPPPSNPPRNPVTFPGDVGQDREQAQAQALDQESSTGNSAKTRGNTVKSISDRQGAGDGDGDGDGENPPEVGRQPQALKPVIDPGYCTHGITVGVKCRACPGGAAARSAA